VSDHIFSDENKLKIFRKEDWNDNFIELTVHDVQEDYDDLPF
jgi:hypothetical protein